MSSEPLNSIFVANSVVAGLLEIAAPFLLGLFLARHFHARWRYWLYGALVFLLFQGVTRVPAMIFIQSLSPTREALKEPSVLGLFIFFAAFTAGLFEEGGRWLAFRFVIRPEERDWRTALMLGAGHGGLESISIGLITTFAMVVYVVVTLITPERLPGYAEQMEIVRKQFSQVPAWQALAGVWERLGTIVIHLALSVMVLQAFARGRRWWWYALAAHTLVDFTGVGLLKVGSSLWGTVPAIIATEALVAVYALLGYWLICALRPKRTAQEPGSSSVETITSQ
jgi:uncharacterized membrane protein YhfC